ncbi:ABC transporter permease [Parafrankia colletiae]|uniref:ABC transporter permease n=1 Tax=Parafrankia colletiae TaxID=573497 RepID=A0A1S1QYA1_9ACTN|nr:iron chelate uptake ABC transporter family permease subunit [Parafrankia colletiae]MCK9900688.1 iron chelate uptake ABC transporter family permease subunit [Frankia sp. Cpl3]OHV38940.1 ABC transporter permease [Parafrankia colletiae]
MPAGQTVQAARAPTPPDGGLDGPAEPPALRAVRPLGLAAAVALLAAGVLFSIALGAKQLPLADVWHVLWHDDRSETAVIVHDLRVPRTLVGLVVGVGLGVAGALAQALTRNSLADPGLLGVNLGASAAVVAAVSFLGVTTPAGYIWFALAGAGAASVAVYVLGATGRAAVAPERLIVAGAALSAVLGAFTYGVAFLDHETFDRLRFWDVAALDRADLGQLGAVAPFIGAGVLLAVVIASALNAMAMGEDAGRGLGVHVVRTRVLGVLAIALMCGAGTAAAGPITFVGLAVPHVARAICGPDQRWVIAYSAVLAPTLLLLADVVGRLIIAPAELEVGVVTALVGAPVFIVLCRRARLGRL